MARIAFVLGIAAVPHASGIAGVVVDSRGEPVARAEVTCGGPELQAKTVADDAGRFAFELAPGSYALGASSAGNWQATLVEPEPPEQQMNVEVTCAPHARTSCPGPSTCAAYDGQRPKIESTFQARKEK